MKKYSTTFLKLTLFIIGLPVLALIIFIAFNLISDPINENYKNIIHSIITGLYLSAIPFYFALSRAFKLLILIDNNNAFSQESVKNLKHIKYSANIIMVIYIIIMPFVFLLAEKDDAPGAIIIGAIPLFVAMVISVFAAVLQRLLNDAIEIKTENDLTV